MAFSNKSTVGCISISVTGLVFVASFLAHRNGSAANGARGSLLALHEAPGTKPAAVGSTPVHGNGSAANGARGSLPVLHGAPGTNPAAVGGLQVHGNGSAILSAQVAQLGRSETGPYRNGRCVYGPRCAGGKCNITWRKQNCTVPPSLQLFDPPAGADFLLRLLHGPPVSIVRLSDGEMSAAAGTLSQDLGGRVDAELRSMVRNAFEDDPRKTRTLHFLNLDWICRLRTFYKRIDEIVSGIPKDRIPCFVNHFGFLTSLMHSPEDFRLTHNHLFRGNCVLVGPKHFSKLTRPDSAFLQCLAHIEVPCCNTGLPKLAQLVAAAVKATSLLKRGIGFVFVSAGLLSKALVPALAQRVGHLHSIVDTGSSFDVFAGKHSRGYTRGEKMRKWCLFYPEFLRGQCR